MDADVLANFRNQGISRMIEIWLSGNISGLPQQWLTHYVQQPLATVGMTWVLHKWNFRKTQKELIQLSKEINIKLSSPKHKFVQLNCQMFIYKELIAYCKHEWVHQLDCLEHSNLAIPPTNHAVY